MECSEDLVRVGKGNVMMNVEVRGRWLTKVDKKCHLIWRAYVRTLEVIDFFDDTCSGKTI